VQQVKPHIAQEEVVIKQREVPYLGMWTPKNVVVVRFWGEKRLLYKGR